MIIRCIFCERVCLDLAALRIHSATCFQHPAVREQQHLRDVLSEVVALVEMGDEANSPGTDLYTQLHLARAALRG